MRGNTTGSTYDFAESFVILMPLPSLTFQSISIPSCLVNPVQSISIGYGIPQRIYAVCAFSAMKTGGRWLFTHIAMRSMNLVFSTPAIGRAHRKRLSTHHRFIWQADDKSRTHQMIWVFARHEAAAINSMEQTPLPVVAAALCLPPWLGKIMTQIPKDNHLIRNL